MSNDKVDKVELIPWDPDNEEQYQRMYDQRVACGWREAEIPSWKMTHLNGSKSLYWIVLTEKLPNKEKLMADHIASFPKERDAIIDTATMIAKTPRKPTRRNFIPIGHTALEQIDSSEAAQFSLPQPSFWIKNLYISWYYPLTTGAVCPGMLTMRRVLQASGIGRNAMIQTERIAASPPFNATAVALDTMRKEFQTSESHLKQIFDDKGLKRPREVRSTEEWYIRQGYTVMEGPEFFEWKHADTGAVTMVPMIYMKKYLS